MGEIIIMDEFKNIISNVPNETLNAFLAIYKDLLTQVSRGSGAYHTFSLMIECIKDEMSSRGMSSSSSYVSESDKRNAINYLSSHGINVGNNSYEPKKENDFFDGILGFGIFILVIIAIALVKGLFDIVVSLWNSGVLKILLGLGIAGGGTYLGYKKGLFEKIIETISEHKEKNNKKTSTKDNSNSKERAKEIGETVKEYSKELAKEFGKDLAIFSTTAVVACTGLAHLEKHTDILENTFLEDFSKYNRIFYEYAGRFVREKKYELFNDYNDLESRGYMDQIGSYNYSNINNLNYEDGECYRFIGGDCTWEYLSYYCYGTPKYAHHLKIYNAYYDQDSILHKGDMVFIPNPELLEEHIYTKKLWK